MENQRDLSLRLYEVLENVGASEKMRKLHKRRATTHEILLTFSTKSVDCNYEDYICGSTFEGSFTPDLSSDIDFITCDCDLIVFLKPHASPLGHYSLLMVRDEWTYPGYVKLQWMQHCVPLTGDCSRLYGRYRLDACNRVCHRLFLEEFMDGPCHKFINKDGKHIADFVCGYKCNTLPVFASSRLDKLRRRGLLADEESERLKSMGCMFVRVGHFLSHEKEIEWRLSLSLQERHLMSRLNPTQHKVYILLKMIKKNILQKIFGCQKLTSYHCKTCVLYAAEMTRQQSWSPDNLITCLMQCIKLLILWLKLGFCPNYFNYDQNLFSKEGFSEVRTLLLHTLELILRTKNKFLALLQTDHVRDLLMEGGDRWMNKVNTKLYRHIYCLNTDLIGALFMLLPRVMVNLCNGHYSILTLITALKFLHDAETIKEHTAAETRAALAYWQPWFHLNIAKSLASISYRCHDRYSRKMMKLADFHFRKADMTDLVNVKLSTATVMFRSEQYEACFWLLQQVENDFTHKVKRICPCTILKSSLSYSDQQDRMDRHNTISSISLRKIMKRFYACCVIFLPSQFQIVPLPLQYEMFRSCGSQQIFWMFKILFFFWFDWIVVDSDVYLYLMQYLVSQKLQKETHKQVAMGNIQAVIEEDNKLIIEGRKSGLGHKETAYNLLGWIYMQEQRYGDAIQCFLNSWKIQPFHNAAKFHMRDLLTTMSERGGHV